MTIILNPQLLISGANIFWYTASFHFYYVILKAYVKAVFRMLPVKLPWSATPRSLSVGPLESFKAVVVLHLA